MSQRPRLITWIGSEGEDHGPVVRQEKHDRSCQGPADGGCAVLAHTCAGGPPRGPPVVHDPATGAHQRRRGRRHPVRDQRGRPDGARVRLGGRPRGLPRARLGRRQPPAGAPRSDWWRPVTASSPSTDRATAGPIPVGPGRVGAMPVEFANALAAVAGCTGRRGPSADSMGAMATMVTPSRSAVGRAAGLRRPDRELRSYLAVRRDVRTGTPGPRRLTPTWRPASGCSSRSSSSRPLAGVRPPPRWSSTPRRPSAALGRQRGPRRPAGRTPGR